MLCKSMTINNYCCVKWPFDHLRLYTMKSNAIRFDCSYMPRINQTINMHDERIVIDSENR